MAKVQDSYYFDTFLSCTEDACKAAHVLEAVMQDFHPDEIRQKIDEIHKIEHSADEKKHALQGVLVKAFITPIEREDILTLSRNIDDMVDKIEDVLQRIYCNNIQAIRPDALEMARKVIQCCEEVKVLIEELADFKHSRRLHEQVVKIAEVAPEQADVGLRDLARKTPGGCLERHLVLVYPKREAVGRHAPRELHRVPGPAEGAVADHLSRPRVELGEDLVEHHGYVPIFSCQDPHPPPTRRRAARRCPPRRRPGWRSTCRRSTPRSGPPAP